MTHHEQGTGGGHTSSVSGAGGVLFAFMVGAAVGAAVALLFAPTTGDAAREVVNRRARESRERVAEAVRQGRGILNRQREHVTTAVERARAQAQAKAGVGKTEPGA
jgi:gas vesicle protein